jgi:hypothetical protein
MRTEEKRCEIRMAVRPSDRSLKRRNTSYSALASKCRGGFVEDQHLRIAHVGAGDGDLLPLPAGQVHAVLEQFAQPLVVTGRQLLDHFVGKPGMGRGRDAPASSRCSMRPTAMLSAALK